MITTATLPPMAALLLPALFLAMLVGAIPAAGTSTFSLDIHHRFSDTVRRWTETNSPHLPTYWPEKGTFDYYAALARHDLVFRGRALSGAAATPVTFIDGNTTARISELGFLHYTVVSLGTPNVKFLVALDTGSNLFWLPCDCSRCAPTSSATYGNNFEFNIYSPNMSITSQEVPCSSSLCEFQGRCSIANEQCQYKVAYVSADTSSSGYLVEDVLYLTTEKTHPKVVQARITFGCGKVQTGSFLEAAAPNGLFGLGMDKISVPSILSKAGLTSDSFSMCFGRDGIGRISFGDRGSSDQAETPFINKQSHPTYNISITGIAMGNSSIGVEFGALIDSGTSFTYLADPAYTQLTESFNAKVRDKRYTSDSQLPFKYCYYVSSKEALIEIPVLSLTTGGGNQFPVIDPIIVISIKKDQYVYCFGVVKSSSLNIIGQNFMTGLRIVFDRERMILGWKKFNCYDIDDTNSLPVNPPNSSTPANGPVSYSPEATKNGNDSQVTVLMPPDSSWSSQLNSFTSITMTFMFLLVIL